jgi:glucose/arabinose dehydrogenase
MKRSTKLVLGGLVFGAAACGLFAARWWKRQHTFASMPFQAPVVANAVPARIRLLPVATGVDRPSDIEFVPGGGTRAVILEQAGKARLVDFGPALKGGAATDVHAAPLVLDLWVRAVSEMGLLGLAFHPKWKERGTMYVYFDPWVHKDLRARVAEFKLMPDDLGKKPAVETRTLVELDELFAIHQGGQVAFGPDGKLYVGFGDGGTANDSQSNGQNLGSLNGKLLRFDVDGPSFIPKDNPFVGRAGARPEVWAYGLRTPWRFSFDGAGHPIVGDVGQEGREEIDLVSKGDNLGWKLREGSICSQSTPSCPTAGLTDPIYDYDRTIGTSVTGGFVVTGSRIPALKGKYVFGDYTRGRIWAMDLPTAAPAAGTPPPKTNPELLGEWPRLFSSFGRDAAGDLYVADQAMGEVLALMPLETAAAAEPAAK